MRNIVERPDGGRIHVARMQGQLFVCADGCCCGRVQDGYAPVPRELYHAEWQRRGLRSRVHLTIGGCLGPCALANVVMLLFQGRQAWFHSMSSDGQVLALYDWIEHLVRTQAWSPPPQALARYHFTASTWEERPHGEESRLTLPLQVQEAGGGVKGLSRERSRADGRRSRRSRTSRAAASVRPERK